MGLQRVCDECGKPVAASENAAAGIVVEAAGERWHVTPVRGSVDVHRACLLEAIGASARVPEVIQLPRRKEASGGR